MSAKPHQPFNAIISVSDPTNLESLGKALAEMGASIYATSGTKARLQAAGVDAHTVSDLTGFPEILGGRIKTLHPGIHLGILAKRDMPDALPLDILEKYLNSMKVPAYDAVAAKGVGVFDTLRTISKIVISKL